MRTKEELKGMAQGIYWYVEHGEFDKAADVLNHLQHSELKECNKAIIGLLKQFLVLAKDGGKITNDSMLSDAVRTELKRLVGE